MSTGIAEDILPSTLACPPPPSNILSNLDISHSQYHPICELHASLSRSPNGNCLNYVLQNAVLEAAVWMSANEQDWPLETSPHPSAAEVGAAAVAILVVAVGTVVPLTPFQLLIRGMKECSNQQLLLCRVAGQKNRSSKCLSPFLVSSCASHPPPEVRP